MPLPPCCAAPVTVAQAGGDPSAATDGVYDGHAEVVRRSVLMWWVPMCDAVLPQLERLIKAGADVRHVNEEGETALDMAERAGERCRRTVALLRRAARGGEM